MSDPYAPPGSQRDAERGTDGADGADGAGRGSDRQRAHRQLPPSVPQPGRRPDRAERRPPDPEAAVRTAKLGMRFSLLVLAGLVALYLPLPWSVGGLVFLLAGGVIGIVALVSAVRARLRAQSVVALSLGLAMTALLVLIQAAQLVLWPITIERQRCLDGALTETALAACNAEYEQAQRDLLPTAP